MLKICLAFWKSVPQYACKRYAYKKTCSLIVSIEKFSGIVCVLIWLGCARGASLANTLWGQGRIYMIGKVCPIISGNETLLIHG